jgi:hypothetical protein
MTNEEFVSAIKLSVSDAAASGMIKTLTRPAGRKPSSHLVRLSAWYNQLSQNDQQVLAEVLKEAAEHAVFGFFCVLDGVRAIEDSVEKGVLELYFAKDGEKVLLNDPRQEQLHNLFNTLCHHESEGTEA